MNRSAAPPTRIPPSTRATDGPLARLLAPFSVLALLIASLALVVAPPGGAPPAGAATRVSTDDCRRIDPNLVNGVCLRFDSGRGSGLTWIGTYRAPDGRIFFCIDFLYDSRLPAEAERVPTEPLVNQLGERVGDAEVAALNYVVSTWAGRGSTGSDERDAAIALIVREVMSDGTRPGGTVVYPGGLEVGERVRAPIGGLEGPVLSLARTMWREASRLRGPWQLSLRATDRGPMRLGRTRAYRVTVTSGAGETVAGARVRLDCRGPIRCRRSVTTTHAGAQVRVRPRETGRFRIRARVAGPSADGLLYRSGAWSAHGGSTARSAGIQRGWIAQQNRDRAVATARTTIDKARPEVSTRTSQALVKPGAAIHDVVSVSGLPSTYDATVVATLHGPYDEQPGAADCTEQTRAGRVRFDVDRDGTFTTPSVVVAEVGYYTWVQRLRGDRFTEPLTTACGIVEETTLVEPFTPRIRTVASRQRAEVGDRVHDTLTVSGLAETDAVATWTLHGPRTPVDGSCRDVSWAGAPVVDTGTLPIAGDGTYRTPSTRLERAGCFTYSQSIAATALSTAATSEPGLARETTLVRRRTPVVRTVVSDQRALTGDRLRDAVTISGLRRDDRVRVQWWLHGPIAPAGDGSCRDLDWTGAPVLDRGEFGAHGNGVRRTRATRIEVAGCYTYSERIAATTSTEPVAAPPGIPSETALVTRPALPVAPEVPSGFEIDRPLRTATPRYLDERYVAPRDPAALGRQAAGSARLSLPRLGLRAPVSPVGLDGTTMAIPNDTGLVGWLSSSAEPADQVGSSVISGHVSDRTDRPGALWRLREAEVGDLVRWEDAQGDVHRFVVRRIERFARTSGLPSRLFRTTGPHVLHLITCADRQATSGGFHYADNLVVTAEAVS